ncbi:MBL fold metallo-hydrolase [Thermosporothrix hazakensis]|uniref:MBL fold metallo-hydrolase n=1 Tax=Thermosporothrix hazakensis TaxID=644383 RepID=UPI001FEA0D83|nr:MBL fold metallo-hydrolase [Thermosporothrix hazakensis]
MDPFLSPGSDRLVPPPFTAEESPAVDYVLCTHEHIDHLDLPACVTLARRFPQTRFIVPRPIVEQLTVQGIAEERIQGVQPGEELSLGVARLFPVPAMHGLSCPPARYDFGFEQGGGLYRYLGYVLELEGIHIYHPGDTLVFDGLVEQLRSFDLDIALLPINGRSYFREQKNLVGNMDEREAADLAAAAGVKLLIPTHYDMFVANLGRPGLLIEYVRTVYPQLSCYVPAHGRRFTFTRGDAR